MIVKKRDLLSVADLTPDQAAEVFDLARTMKHEPKGSRLTALAGRSIAIVLEKASTRTRVSFEVGAAQLGAHPVVIPMQGSQLMRGEPVRDTARVLAGYSDMIIYRTSDRARLHEMATAPVPVVNALSDDGHPVQVLCDIFTIQEALGTAIGNLRIAFVGDCANNMGRSWVEAAGVFGFELLLAGPEGYMPDEAALALGKGNVTITHDPQQAARNVDVVNTDVWASMGQEEEATERFSAFTGFTVSEAMLSKSPNAIVLHCLPAHRGEEIDDATLEGPRSRVWAQAENRLHVQKGLMLFLSAR
jgi:ornithine carbamoyltransferase